MNLKELLFGGGVQSGDSGGAYRDSIQAWLPIKNIIGGVVITKDNRFVKILEVLPVNIYLKSTNDRQNIISSFAAYLKIAPNDLQMIARTLPADTQAYVEQMQRYLNIGYMEGISDVFNSIRGFNMSVQLAVQSLSQWKEKYPGTEWENQLNAFDRTIYMGCNDLTSAKYFAEKCGKVTISVTNNQFPLMPLFSPVYSSTRPYSQTRSNTQRDLLQADEFLRLDRYKCVVMFNHYKPAHLYKIMLEELPEYKQLRKCSVFDYEPEWKSREEAERQRRAPEKRSDMEETESPPNLQQSTRNPDAHGAARQAADPPVAGKPSVPQRQETGNTCIYDIPSMKNATPESIGLVEMTRSAIISSDDPELEEMDDPSRIPPGRGI